MRCAFCGHVFIGPYPKKTAGVFTVKCEQCRRAFIIQVKKHWWGFVRTSHVR